MLDHSCFPEYSDHAELVADSDHTDQVVASKVTAAESDNTAAGTACMVSSEAGKSVADTDCTAGAEEVDTGNRQKQERLLTDAVRDCKCESRGPIILYDTLPC